MNILSRFLTLSCFSLLLIVPKLNAQISFGGEPALWENAKIEALQDNIPTLTITPTFNGDDLRATQEWQNQQIGSPLFIGKEIKTKIDFTQKAQRIQNNNEQEILRLCLKAKDAKALSIGFSKFSIPLGAKLFIYDRNRSTLLGAFTSESNPSGGIFATTLINGQEAILDYEAPRGSSEPQIEIDHIGYIYNTKNTIIEKLPRTLPGEGSSGLCQVNINCSEGNNFRKQQDAVVQILTKMGENYAVCTGTLLNNTLQDFTPYIITAGHCFSLPNIKTSDADLKEWVFTFHYERPFCENNMRVKEQLPSMVGCVRKAFLPLNGMSDGLLLELTQKIPEHYGAYYAGWKVENEAIASAVGLHHPRGDVMKIATVKTKAVDFQALVGEEVGGKNAHWNVRFAKTENGHSVTEGGSSGSGLFNDEGLLIATLTGGSAECDKLIKGSNLYGKLAFHWDKYLSKGESYSMAKFLDPKGKGSTHILQGAYANPKNILKTQPIKGLKAIVEKKGNKNQIVLSWESPNEKLDSKWKIYIKEEGENIIASLDANANKYTIETPQSKGGIATYEIYFAYTPEGGTSAIPYSISTLSVYLAEPHPLFSVKKIEKPNGIELIWKRPILRQKVSSCLDKSGSFSSNNKYDYPDKGYALDSLFFGCRYNGYDFTPVQKNRIIGMSFLPAKSYKLHKYSLYLRNGYNIEIDDRHGTYSYAPDNDLNLKSEVIKSKFDNKNWILYPFNKAFSINPKEMLIAGIKLVSNLDYSKSLIQIDSKASSYASRNNVFSFDGKYWMALKEAYPSIKGALTMQLILDDGNIDAPISLEGAIPFGLRPAAFPKLIGYKIFINDVETFSIDEPSTSSFLCKNVKTDDKIDVRPIYEGGRVALANTPISYKNLSSEPIVYPSCFQDKIYLKNSETIHTIEVFSQQGEKILSISRNNLTEIDLTSLSSGAYFIRLSNPSSAWVFKVLKTN